MPDILSVAAARLPDAVGREVILQGWVRTRRDSKAGFSFLEINDGSCFGNIQVLAEAALPNYEAEIKRLSAGCSVSVTGLVKASPGKGQATEVAGPQRDRPRLGRRRNVSLAEEGALVRVPPHDRPPAAADQHLRRHGPGAELRLPLDPRVLPGRGLPLRPHADHHGQRLRRGRGDVPGHHARPAASPRRCRKSGRLDKRRHGKSISRSISSTGRPI